MTSEEILLVLRAQSGDAEALDGLLRSVQEPLFRYLQRLAGSRELAEDALQETFVRIARKLKWLDEPRFFRTWAFRIASREALRILKREQRIDSTRADETLAEELPAPADPVERATVLPLLDRVSQASRAVILLHYFEELSLQEVADALQLQPGTAKSRLAYGLQQLRRLIRESS